VAIKSTIFEVPRGEGPPAATASEAAIASTLVHPNVVATYAHELRSVGSPVESAVSELAVYRLYLVQVCSGNQLLFAPKPLQVWHCTSFAPIAVPVR
jgi:hypothetical protein